MVTCIHCGKSGKKICDTCLEKAKKDKLIFLSSLQKDEIATIIEACKPKFEKVLVTTPASKSNVPAVIKRDVIKPPVVKEEQKPTVQVENTLTTTRKITIPTTTSQPTETTTTTTNRGSLDDGDKPRLEHIDPYVLPYRGAKTAVAIIECVIIATLILVALILDPWNIGQWIAGVLSGIIIFFGFWIAASSDVEFIGHDVFLFIITAGNIALTIWLESDYSIISLAWSIALAASSSIVMVNAYAESEAKQGHWALLCMAINIAFIFWDKMYVYIEPIYTYIIGLF